MKKTLAIFLSMAVLLCAAPHMVFAATTTEVDGMTYTLDEENKTATLTNGKNASSNDVLIPGSVNYNGTDYSVTTIGSEAFSWCSKLTSVTIGSGVQTIGNSAFKGCSSLTSINVDSDNPNFKSDESGVLFNKDCTKLISCPGGKTGSYTISGSVTSIGYGAFAECSKLTSIKIPGYVTKIGDDAFFGCRGLTSVEIPGSVTSISDHTFDGCSGLTSVKIPDSVTTIGEYAFQECNNLTSVDIPGSVTTIGMGAFTDCGLTSITIPDSVTTIGDYPFRNCGSLESVTIQNSTISYATFENCRKLESVTIGKKVESIGSSAFERCSGLTSITIPCNFDTDKFEGTYIIVGEGNTFTVQYAGASGTFALLHDLEEVEGKAADCVNDGETTHYICNNCKKLFSDADGKNIVTKDSLKLGKLGHDFGEWETTKEPACTTAGEETRTCKRTGCGTPETRSIAATGHDMGDWNVTKEPACTTAGEETRTCKRTGCGTPETRLIAALGHDFGEWKTTKEPACTTAGEETRTCKRTGCGTPETRTIAATGHNLTKTEKREPTCVAEGMNEYWKCSECKLLFSDEDGTKSVIADELKLSKLDHDWDAGEVTTAATPEKSGVKTYKCSRCGETKTEPVEYVSVPGGGNGDSTDSQPGTTGGDNNSTNLHPGAGGGDSNSSNLSPGTGNSNSSSTNLYSDAEPAAIAAKRASIKTGDQRGIWVMFDMALLLMSAYGVLVGVRSRRKKYEK